MILAGNHYKGMPDQLLITIDVGKEQFTTLQPDSIQIEWQGRLIRPQAVHYESTVLIHFAISPGQARHLPAQQLMQDYPETQCRPRPNRLDLSFLIPADALKAYRLHLNDFRREETSPPLQNRARQWIFFAGP